jgi:hypothetical protein
MLGLHSEEGRVLISGDLSISPQRTVAGAKPPPFQPDVLILESTYGGRLHANRAVQEKLLVETVGQVVEAGGKVLIPAFALGRAQELLLILSEFRRRGALPAAPVWADGMVRAICQAYASFAESLPLALQERGAAFFDEQTRPVQTNAQRNALVWDPSPAIIVASSGMLAGGPALAYARALAGSPQHAILLTGYQDEESPGRRLQEVAQRGRGSLYLGKDKVEVQCRLGTYSLSAHADEGQLVSLAETLDPAHVALVHGDEPARASLAQALTARQRIVHQPHAGQTLEFRFDLRQVAPARRQPVDRPLDVSRLWQEVAAPHGGLFLLDELARAWWGAATPENLAALSAALAGDGLRFLPDPQQPGLYRARSADDLDRSLRRRDQLAGYGDLSGHWLALRRPKGEPALVRCLAQAADHLQVEADDGAVQAAWPEDILQVFGATPPDPEALARLTPQTSAVPVSIEPNQALSLANQHFPAAARLRKCGYRLETRQLVLTFDFPDAARQKFGDLIESLQTATGWEVTLSPEANQSSLASLARALLPAGWQVVKGPALRREQKQVAVTVAGGEGAGDLASVANVRQQFLDETGYELVLTFAERPAAPGGLQFQAAAAGERLEINQAYAVIKAALTQARLYRASLKGEEIVLSFISPQVGQRYQAEVAALAQQTGWPLSVNPQPNQGAVLEAARTALEQEGCRVQKGPSLFPGRDEVTATLIAPPEAEGAIERAAAAILEQTGYRLVVSIPKAAAPPQTGAPAAGAVEIPVARIRLSRHQQGLSLDPQKLAKTVEHARRLGQITPPIRVRRLSDGYLLLDGLYRLQAAVELGLERIWADVE